MTLGSSVTDVIDDGAMVSPSSFSHLRDGERLLLLDCASGVVVPVASFLSGFAFLPGPTKASPLSNQ